MKDIIPFLDSKQFKKLLRNRDFVFIIVCYPIALLIYIILRIYIANADLEDSAGWYAVVSFVALGFLAIISLFERIEKRVTYKIQGDKLKLKRMERNWKD